MRARGPKLGPLKWKVKIETKSLTKNEKCLCAPACRKKDCEGPGKPLCMVIEEGQNYKLAISGSMPKCAKIFPGHICAFFRVKT